MEIEERKIETIEQAMVTVAESINEINRTVEKITFTMHLISENLKDLNQ